MLKRKLFIYCLLVVYNLKAQITYPSTKKIPVMNTYHGVDITDHYQWFENFSSPEVTEWVSLQNKVT